MAISDLDSADGTQQIAANISDKYSPDPSALTVGVSSPLLDASERLETHSSVLSDEGSIRDDFTGAALSADWINTTGGGGTITVANSIVNFNLSNSSASRANTIREADYLPYTLNCYALLTARNAAQTFVLGFQDSFIAPTKQACVVFDGTVNTTVKFVTSSSVAASDIQTTTVTLPNGLTTATYNYYKIDLSGSRAVLSINGIIVATHDQHIPGPYDLLSIQLGGINTGNTVVATLSVDFIYLANWNRLQIDNDFQGEPIAISGSVSNSPVDGSKSTFSAAATGLTVAANATDIFTITGSATKTIRIISLEISATQTTAGNVSLLVLKRSTANAAGTSTTLTNVRYDATHPAATAVVRSYTANPTLGTLVGNIKSARFFISTGTTLPTILRYEFGKGPSQAIILRGTNEVLAVNLNGVSVAGSNFSINIEWTEE